MTSDKSTGDFFIVFLYYRCSFRCEQEPKTKVDEQLNRLQEQMKALVDKVERSSDLIAHVQNDVKAIKEKPSSFREAVGNVQPEELSTLSQFRKSLLDSVFVVFLRVKRQPILRERKKI